jgi:inorganic triphosphatase YgiF
MGSETELKFQVSPQDLKTLRVVHQLRPLDDEPKKSEKLLSVYFDTAECRLRRKGISLRVRHIGDYRLQTIKTQTSGIPFSRGEWEHRIDSDVPDLRLARGAPLAPLRNKNLSSKLVPLFATHVHRVTRSLREGGSRIEMALDQGVVRAGRKAQPISEVELELKRGKVADLFKLAKVIEGLVPAKLAFKSKSERGYDLVAGATGRSSPAEEIKLEAGMSAGKAFQAIGRSILRHLTENESAVREGDSEGVHQMRVGLRKLRAAIAIFSELLNDKQTKAIKGELIWVTNELGPARDLDVYIKTTVEPLEKLRPRKRGLREFGDDLVSRRKAAFKKTKDAVDSPRFRSLILDTLQWIEAGDWLKHSRVCGGRPIGRFAADSIARQRKKVLKKQKGMAEFDSLQLHKLRIKFKKLRYSCDFFWSLCAGRKMKRHLKRFKDCLSDLQDNLGALNDICVHQKLATALVSGRKPRRRPARDFAAGVVSGREQSEIQPLLRAAGKTARKLAQMRPFLT